MYYLKSDITTGGIFYLKRFEELTTGECIIYKNLTTGGMYYLKPTNNRRNIGLLALCIIVYCLTKKANNMGNVLL